MESQEEVALEFKGLVPLSRIAARLCMNETQFYLWVKGKWPIRRTIRQARSVAAVSKEDAKSIIAKAKAEGLENPHIVEEKAYKSVPDESEQPGTLAYRVAHPPWNPGVQKRLVKAEPSSDESKGDMQFIEWG